MILYYIILYYAILCCIIFDCVYICICTILGLLFEDHNMLDDTFEAAKSVRSGRVELD